MKRTRSQNENPDPGPSEVKPEAKPKSLLEAAGPSPNGPAVSAETAPDPHDVSRCLLGTDYAAAVGVSKLLLEVPVRKPNRETWFRVHPDPTFRSNAAVLEVGGEGIDRELFLVLPELWPSLQLTESTFGTRLLLTYYTRQGVVGLWPIKLVEPGGRPNPWSRSALQAAELAQTRWARVQADTALGAYRVDLATGIGDEPRWPDCGFHQLLKIAFKDHVITSPDHPVLKKLRGEV
jgi:hypothetical protein